MSEAAISTNRDYRSEAISLKGKNQRLSEALTKAREQLLEMRTQLERIGQAPANVGVVAEPSPNPEEAKVFLNGKLMILARHPKLGRQTLKVGMQVRVSEEMIISEVIGYPRIGQLATVGEVMPTGCVLVRTSAQENEIVTLAEPLIGEVHAGDSVLLERVGHIAVAKIQRGEVEQLLAPQVPNVSYDEIGGLQNQIEQIRDAVELPFRHPDLYRKYGLRAPKGILLYGPPGCGKTLIAKAVATSLGKKSSSTYFLSIKGPELLSKFVGETERQIRAIFNRARELASADHPVVVFFDEMEALFRTRGSGVSSDVETMIVPQLLVEIDGVEALSNVIVIGASNREDMIDPAVLRPGRLDVRIRIERPSLEDAGQIFNIHFAESTPVRCAEGLSPADARTTLCSRLLDLLGEETDRTALYDVTYHDGTTRRFYAKHLLSGAMIAGIVERAKKEAIKDALQGDSDRAGVCWHHLEKAALAEINETAGVGAAGDVNEWARTLGQREKNVTHVQPLH